MGPGGLCHHVHHLGGAVIDDRAHDHGDVVEHVEPVTHRAPGRGGHAVDDVSVAREIVLIDREHRAVGAERSSAVEQLVQVHRRGVVHGHFANSGADQGREKIPDALGLVDPVRPRADQVDAPLLLDHLAETINRTSRRSTERVAVEVHERAVADDELLAPVGERICGVERQRTGTGDVAGGVSGWGGAGHGRQACQIPRRGCACALRAIRCAIEHPHAGADDAVSPILRMT